MMTGAKPLLTDKRPDLFFNYDLTLVRRGYWRWRKTDYGKLPDIRELVDEDELWESDLARYSEWVDFFEDAGKTDSG